MNIKGFYIDGYKSLKKLFIPMETKLSVLVGPNDSGKTAILEVLGLFYKGISDGRRIRRLESGMFYKREFDTIRIAVVFNECYQEDSNKWYSLMLSIKARENSATTESYRDYIDVSVSESMMLYDYNDNSFQPLEEKTDISRYTLRLPSLIFIPSRRSLEEAYGGKRIIGDVMKPIVDRVLKDRNAKRGLETLERRINEELKTRLQEVSRRLSRYGLKGNLRPRTSLQVSKGLSWEFTLEEEGLEIPLTEKGEGIQNITLLELYRVLSEKEEDNREYLLMIDEIENHLYPSLMHIVLSAIMELIKRNYYVLLVTHSPIIINNLHPSYILFAKKEQGKTKLISVSLEEDLLKVNKELGIKLSDVLGARVIILVEGKHDKKFVEYLVNETMTPGLNCGVYAFSIDGADKAQYYARVYSSIADRYSCGKVLVILDGDNPGVSAARSISHNVNLKSYIGRNILTVKHLPEGMTIEDALLRDNIVPIVVSAVREFLSSESIDDSVIEDIIKSLHIEIKDSNKPLLDTLGRILAKSKELQARKRIIGNIKEFTKDKIWEKVIKEELWELSKIGKDLKEWLENQISGI